MKKDSLLEKIIRGDIKPGRVCVPEKYREYSESNNNLDYYDANEEEIYEHEKIQREVDEEKLHKCEVYSREDDYSENDNDDDIDKEINDIINKVDELFNDSEDFISDELESLEDLFESLKTIGYVRLKNYLYELLCDDIIIKPKLNNDGFGYNKLSYIKERVIKYEIDNILKFLKEIYDNEIESEKLRNEVRYIIENNFNNERFNIEYAADRIKLNMEFRLDEELKGGIKLDIKEKVLKQVYYEKLIERRKERGEDGLTNKQRIKKNNIEKRRKAVSEWIEIRKKLIEIRKKRRKYEKLTRKEKQLLKAGCITQKELANKLGVSIKTIELDIKYIKQKP